MKHKAPDLSPYQSLGEALQAALERHAHLTALIEADRERENCRLTYADFKTAALPVAHALQELGFAENHRAAIIMSNQSRWLISAYAIFYSGGVLVPVDYKLTAPEQLALLAHAKVQALVVEYPIWRALMQAANFKNFSVPWVFVTEAPANAGLGVARRWEAASSHAQPRFVPRGRQDLACIVYSSGTGGRPKGCMLTHDNYLEQCQSLMTWYPFWPGMRYLSILPTNHAIDFMVGFIGPFVCGATVVHLRTLRPEFLKAAFPRYQITYASLVPMVLKALETGLRSKIAELPPFKQWLVRQLIRLNRQLTRHHPIPAISRRLFPQIHAAFGNQLLAIITGGAFAEPSNLQFFYDLGIPVANGYGLTEAGTAITVNDLHPFRADTVGKPLPGFEVKLINCDNDAIGEIVVRGRTVMNGYLDDPDLTAESFSDGWLRTGDLGRFDSTGHLQLFGRLKNMIVTEGGKNIYPEDIENVFDGIPVKEYSVFAANYIWPQRTMLGEKLLLVVHLEPGAEFNEALLETIRQRNRRLADFKRISGTVLWDADFPRTASMKIMRSVLASQIGSKLERQEAEKPI